MFLKVIKSCLWENLLFPSLCTHHVNWLHLCVLGIWHWMWCVWVGKHMFLLRARFDDISNYDTCPMKARALLKMETKKKERSKFFWRHHMQWLKPNNFLQGFFLLLLDLIWVFVLIIHMTQQLFIHKASVICGYCNIFCFRLCFFA